MKRIIWISSFRYLIHHPWQVGLSILGVALGVAVVIAIDLTNESAKRAFALSVESLTGKATHQIVSLSGDLPEDLYRQLRIEWGIRQAAPLIEGILSVPEQPGRTLRILGIDPFADRPFRNYLSRLQFANFEVLPAFLTQPNSILLSSETATELGIKVNDKIQVSNGIYTVELHLIEVLKVSDELAREALKNLIIADISTAQEILDKTGFLSEINLILPPGPKRQAKLEQLKEKLPYGTRLQAVTERVATAEKLTRSFHLNLTALSLLTLIVGMFLIYNTMTFSVVQRYSLFGRLRALGMTRQELFVVLISEALLIGSIGTVIGLVLGIVLAQGLVKLVTQTINDLYYVVSVREVYIAELSVAKAAILGIVVSLGAALIPAREAAQIPPGIVMKRSAKEESYRKTLPWGTLIGFGLLGFSVFFLWWPSQNLYLVYVAVFLMILGFAVLMPVVTILVINLCHPLLFHLFKTPGLLTTRGVKTELSRTGVAIAALMVALATAVGVGIMVESFRNAVVLWLQNSLRADVYFTATSLTSQQSRSFLPPELIQDVSSLSGIAHVGSLHRTETISKGKSLKLLSVLIPPPGQKAFRFKEQVTDFLWKNFEQEDTVLITEPLAYRFDLNTGETLMLQTPAGEKPFRILGVYYDYGNEQGHAFISRSVYQKHWQDSRIQSIALYLEPTAERNSIIEQLRQLAGNKTPVLIRSNEHLLQHSIAIFDRTFAITRILRLLVVGVAFLGVFSALMALELEKQREMGVLRIVGLTPWQLWGVVMGQCGLMGAIAGLAAFPVGYLLSQVLIHVINQRSFGWTFETVLSPEIWGQVLLLGVVAALCAGIYPAFKMARIAPADALREE